MDKQRGNAQTTTVKTAKTNNSSEVGISILLATCILWLIVALAVTHIALDPSISFLLSLFVFPLLFAMPLLLIAVSVVSVVVIVRAVRQLVLKDKVALPSLLLSISALLLAGATFVPSAVDHGPGMGTNAIVTIASFLPGGMLDTTKYASYDQVKEKIDSCEVEYASFDLIPGKGSYIRSNSNIYLRLKTTETINRSNFQDFRLYLPYSDRLRVYDDMKASGCYSSNPALYGTMRDELPESL